jgi:hypothetical protein
MKRLISVLLTIALIVSVIGITPVFAADTEIASVEVTQVMGKGIDLETGKYYFMNTFVANKPTSIQVVMDESYKFSDSDSVTVFRDGKKITEISPDKSEKTQIMTFTPSKSEVNSWAAGRYKFTANIDGDEHSTEAIFNESREFSVLAVGASVKYNGEIIPAPHMDSDTVVLRTQAIPVSENKLIRRYNAAPISFGTGENGYDLADSGSSLRLLSDIENYRLKSAANYDVIVVVVDSYISEESQNGGYTNSNHAIVLSLKSLGDTEFIDTAFLHELGHITGNGDEYENGDAKPDVNGLPYGVSATNSNGDTVTGNREYFTHASGNTFSGIMLNDTQNPYNPKSGGVMLNTSSFMGSSYTHWTTSMVWEQAYEKLIPNYNNVLPKVYTDGTLVPERNLDNALNSETLENLRRDWYEMCNSVRVEKGYSAYTYDEYFEIGEDFFQKEAEKTMQKGETEIILDFDKVFRPIGVTPYERFLSSHIHEWLDTDLEYFKSFFEQSSCGAGFMAHDYMVIAFMEVGGRLFYSYTTFHDITALSDTAETVLPQPESPPVLEINPADNELKIVESEIIEEIVTEPPYSDPEYTDPEEPSSGDLPAFEDYTEEMKQRMLWYDGFDIGLSGVGNYDDFPYLQWDNAAAYLGWWAGQEFGRKMTGEETKAFVEAAYDTGEYNQWQVSAVIADQFGKEMLTDEDGNWYIGDGDISDPDGEW